MAVPEPDDAPTRTRSRPDPAGVVGRDAADGSSIDGRRVAAFDVDGTLTTRDCVVPFLRTVAGTTGLVTALARRALPVARAGVRRDRDTLKVLAGAAVFEGRRVADVEATGRSFALRILGSWLRPDTLAALRAHQVAGTPVVLVSASFGVYLRPLAEHLGIDAVIATELASVDGVYSGELVDGNCRGPEKLRRLHRLLAERHGGRAQVELWAYGDSAGDAPMLADADRAVWVGADAVALP